MKFIVEITFRDDTVKLYKCFEPPYVTDWITLYMNDKHKSRQMIPKEAIAGIRYWYV